MKNTFEAWLDPVEAAVAEIEKHTDVEIVTAIARASDSYTDIRLRTGILTVFASGALLMLAPWSFSQAAFALLVLFLGWVGDQLAGRPALLRRLAPASRMEQAVRQRASRVFIEAAVHGTPHRSAILIYVSLLEQRVEVIADLGIHGLIPAGVLKPAARALVSTDPDAFVASLKAFGEVLATRMPHQHDSDETDLPNRPLVFP